MGDRPGSLEMGSVQIPHYFRCPISLELMADPVTISTGQTYDRESIESWVSAGNSTCPVTRAPLVMKDFTLIPNHTLRRLIQHWCVSNPSSGLPRIPAPRQPPTPALLLSLLSQATSPSSSPHSRLSSLTRLSSFSSFNPPSSSSSSSSSSPSHYSPTLISFLSDPLLCLPSLAVLAMFPLDSTTTSPSLLPTLVSFLFHPSLPPRLHAASLLQSLISLLHSHQLLAALSSSPDIFAGVVGLLRTPTAEGAGVGLLSALCVVREARREAVEAGCVEALAEVLSGLEKDGAERAFKSVELLSRIPEGCDRLCGEPMVVPLLVRAILRVSEKGTEYAAAALFSLCSGSEVAQREAVGAGAVTQLLLLVQSGCSERAKKKATSLLKLFRDSWPQFSLANSDDFGYSEVFLEA